LIFDVLPAAVAGTAATAGSAGSLALMEAGATGAVAGGLSAGLPAAAGASWLPSLATGLAVGGTILDAGAGLIQANQEAGIMEANAKIAEQEGLQKKEAAKAETLKLSQERRRTLGTQAALLGASGTDLTSGSPLEVMAQTAADYERDIQLKGYQGDLGMRSSLAESEIYKYGASGRRKAGLIGAGGTLLTGYGRRSLLGKYY
jgi:hypothetical protein